MGSEMCIRDRADTRLLKDALVGLEDPFLLVVVGEFNSGKSTVINALLGSKYLEEGILPTTNEISILKHAERKETTERVRNLLHNHPLFVCITVSHRFVHESSLCGNKQPW